MKNSWCSVVVQIEIPISKRFNISRLLLTSSRKLRGIQTPNAQENFRIGH